MKKALILCTGNSCRSQMAEALLSYFSKNTEIYSAGTKPEKVNPFAIKAMAEIGIDISKNTSNHVDEYTHIDFDYVFTVCDNAKNTCPNFPDGKIIIHWSIKDPFHGWNDNEEDLEPYRMARNEIKAKIKDLLQKEEIKNL